MAVGLNIARTVPPVPHVAPPVQQGRLKYKVYLAVFDKRIRPTQRVAFLGNYLPRQCGIATFTTDLSTAIAAEFPKLDCLVLAMNDPGPRRPYPSRVRFELDAAEKLKGQARKDALAKMATALHTDARSSSDAAKAHTLAFSVGDLAK